MKYTFCLVLTFLVLATSVSSQNEEQEFWSPVKEVDIHLAGVRQIIPQKFRAFALNGSALKAKLFHAPHQKDHSIFQSQCIISLPLPNGSVQRFRVVESPVMEDALAAAFPGIKTWSVKGIDDPHAIGRIDWNDFGFHGMILSVRGDFFIDPYCVNNTHDYISYYTRDFDKPIQYRAMESEFYPDANFQKMVGAGDAASKTGVAPAACVGTQLRSYQIAVACTGEYAMAATGFTAPTVQQTLAKIVTSVNRVNTVYQREVAVELVLVATETLVIFPDSAADPFSHGVNNNANALILRSQQVIDSLIGNPGYDIGHTFSTGGGGQAGLGVVCLSGTKARGVTGNGNPVGDPYDIDFVAHEVGHQFRGSHSFNAVTGNCNSNRMAAAAVEPGSGVTIMGYAGICPGNDVASHSIPNFHAISYDEIVNFVMTGAGSACPVITSTGNNPPIVGVSATQVVPKSTAFVLTGSATDPDGDKLYYSWEETDLGTAPGNWNSGSKPFFRSHTPDSIDISATSYSQSFPGTAALLSGNYDGIVGEYAPKTAQTLNFRFTVRDNRLGGGGVCYSSTSVVIDDAGPLKVTHPSDNGVFWVVNTPQVISWDVNGTDQGAVNCDLVTISISFDGGKTYSVITSSTPNDGSYQYTTPNLPQEVRICRMKIECADNAFYDISDFNFTIAPSLIYLGVNSVSRNNPVGLNVWPNPFSEHLNISVSNLDTKYITHVTLVDMLGKELFQHTYSNITELKEILNLSGLSGGVYFIRVSNNGNESVHRIVKEGL